MLAAPEFIEMREHGDDAGEVSGFHAMSASWRRGPSPDGVFCYNDPTAMGRDEGRSESRLAASRRLAVAGCGNLAYADFLRVPLTSVDQRAPPSGNARLPDAFRCSKAGRGHHGRCCWNQSWWCELHAAGRARISDVIAGGVLSGAACSAGGGRAWSAR